MKGNEHELSCARLCWNITLLNFGFAQGGWRVPWVCRNSRRLKNFTKTLKSRGREEESISSLITTKKNQKWLRKL